MAVVKGCEWEAARVKEATLLLIEHLCAGSNGSGSQVFPVTMTMEISPIHHSVVVGKNNINLRVIMQRTNTTILFPDAADPNIPPIRKGSVSITGAIHNVYLARQQLVGSLPLVMMFDMPDGVDVIDTDMVQKMGEELDVSISIKSKHRQGCKSVLIKAQERHASAIYGARRRLLNIEDDEEPPVVADVPETYKIQPIPPHLMQTLGNFFCYLHCEDLHILAHFTQEPWDPKRRWCHQLVLLHLAVSADISSRFRHFCYLLPHRLLGH